MGRMIPLLPRDFPKKRDPYPWRDLIAPGLIMITAFLLDALIGR